VNEILRWRDSRDPAHRYTISSYEHDTAGGLPFQYFHYRPTPMRCSLLTSPTAREAELQRLLDLAVLQLSMVLRLVGDQRLALTDTDRRAIAEHAHAVGWKAARAILLVATLGTVQKWFRRLIAKPNLICQRKRSPGRPPIGSRTRTLVKKIAIENPTWGYDRIADTINQLGIDISDQTVGNILKSYGIPPAGERGARRRRWRHFLATHWQVLASCDFTSIPVISLSGIRWMNVLVIMRLATRQVHVAVVHATPDATVMAQVARNLTMADAGFFSVHGIRYLIRDRDGKFSPPFTKILDDAGIETVLTPVEAPNANAHIERWFLGLKSECTNRLWIIGERALRFVLDEYIEHFHRERHHQGTGHRLIDPGPEVKITTGPICRRKRLGGLLSYYHRAA
jgi:putative transposase